MIHEELFVGLVAVALGGVGLAAAALNWEQSYRLQKAQWVEARLGRGAVRVAYALIGAMLILLGLAIALGFGPNVRNSAARDSQQNGPDAAKLVAC